MAGDPYWNNVVLALHMDGTNGSTTFTDLKGHAMTAIGNAQISTAQSKFGGASALFDGTTDAVSVANASDLALGADDFTMEAFVRFASVSASVGILVRRTSGVVNNCFSFWFDKVNGLSFSFSVLGTENTTFARAWAPATNTWYHVAVSRVGPLVRLFVDGTQLGADYFLGRMPLFSSTEFLLVGAFNYGLYSSSFNGHIDDLRITKGVARYTANFTPPALAFPDEPAQISGTVKDSAGALGPRAVRVYRKSDGALAGATTSHSTTGVFSVPALDASPHYAITHDSDADPYWPNVVLASHFNTDSVIDQYMSSVVLGLHMEGTNAGTTFTDVTGKTMTANGNVVTSTATARFGNTSAKFDGTTDWISTPDNAGFDFGSGDFTVEAFVYVIAYTTGSASILTKKALTGTFGPFVLSVGAAGLVSMQLSTNGSTYGLSATSASAIGLSAWRHLALVRSGTTFTIYQDGTSIASGTLSGALTTNATALTVGANADGSNSHNGYLDDVRITKGVARYTANFTPPTAPFGSFKDLTGKDLMISGTPSINTTTKKYGDGSLALNGTLTHLEVPISTDLTFGSADFTIELYAYLASTATAGLIAMGTGNNQLQLYSNTSNLLLYASSTGSSWDIASAAVIKTSFTTAQWYHIAICRKGGTLMAFLDGVNVLNIAVGTTVLTTPRTAIFVGSQTATTNALNGYIDDLRVTNGIARYQADFTPPERAFSGPMAAGTSNALIFDDLTPD